MDPANELHRLVTRFVSDPREHGPLWASLAERPSGLFHQGLEQLVADAEMERDPGPLIVACFETLTSPSFKVALGTYYDDRGLGHINTERLATNAAGLLATAMTAASAHALSRDISAEQSAKAQKVADFWAAQASAILQPVQRAGAVPQATVVARAESDPAWHVEHIFDLLCQRQPTLPVGQAFFWTLYWLSRHQLLESGRSLRLPIAAVDARTRIATLAHLHLTRLTVRQTAELFEHPNGCLVPLGARFLAAMIRAWNTADPQSACWELASTHSPQDGDSFSGAAATGFRNLSHGRRYLETCLVIGRLGEGDRLLPAGFEEEKLRESFAKGIRVAVLAAPVEELGAHTLSDTDSALSSLGLTVVRVTSLEEAAREVAGQGEAGLRRTPEKLLDRYSPRKELDTGSSVRLWVGSDDDDTFLIKAWPLDEDTVTSRVGRALWDRELRNLYRLRSSSSADRSLVVLHDAGLDRRAGLFVMVMKARGYVRLAEALQSRQKQTWLTRDGLSDVRTRRDLWRALKLIATGIYILHRHDLVHRNIAPENVFFNPEEGLQSFRLGGFEWSVRFGGEIPEGAPPGNWHIPPEVSVRPESGITFDDDWYAFGMLAVRCFYNVESLAPHRSVDVNALVNEHLEKDTGLLKQVEIDFLKDLIRPDRRDRLTFSHDILRRFQAIDEDLNEGSAPSIHDGHSLVLVFSHTDIPLVQDITSATGLQFTKTDEGEEIHASYDPQDPRHVLALKQCVIDNFATRTIFADPTVYEGQFLLVGRVFSLVIGKMRDETTDIDATWNEARGITVRALSRSQASVDIADIPLLIVAKRERRPAQKRSWEPLLPIVEDASDNIAELKRFRDFLRCTNQIELALRCTEVFPCQVVASPSTSPGFRAIRVMPRPMSDELVRFSRGEGGMLEFLRRELEANKRSGDRVLLSKESDLRWRPASDAEEWQLGEITNTYAELRRVDDPGLPPPPSTAFLRSVGFKGQVRLIERRKAAIDRLDDHWYLLMALAYPAPVIIDTRQTALPLEVPEGVIDDSKRAVLQDILRTRPIYTLMGPPGTGKTTLVSHLLRQILEEDPVAQILVTAQAHGAVDVLREKVEKVFQDLRSEHQPIMVRLGIGDNLDADAMPEGVVEQKARRILQEAKARLDASAHRSPIEERWHVLISRMSTPAGAAEEFSEFVELVRRGANVVFCTTSAGDLEDLAKGDQFFDWVVVEEAGKVHGYDLALPLQAGHRWMLLGDYKQLAPYREDDFRLALNRLSDVIAVVDKLGSMDRSLVDRAWVDSWQRNSKAFITYAEEWLRSFEKLFKLHRVRVKNNITTVQSIGATAGMLSSQYRMHPAIGDLISETFYSRTIRSETDDSLLHRFKEPFIIAGKALVWIDLPWSERDPRYREHSKPRYTNPQEAVEVVRFLRRLRFEQLPEKNHTVAVLSPYNRQSHRLNQELQSVQLCEGLEFRESLFTRRNTRQGPRRAHTVDSFQGNQADVIVVSLTRNNSYPLPLLQATTSDHATPHPLGFLDKPERLNVLLSRAERLLVLVGSWEFFERQTQIVTSDQSEDSYLWHWKKLLTIFEETIKTGRGIRIPASAAAGAAGAI